MGNNNDFNIIREWIEAIKYKKRITQREIADKLGVTKSYLSDVASGRSPLSDKLKQRISELYSDCIVDVSEQQYVGCSEPTPQDFLPLIPIEAVAGFPTMDTNGVSVMDCEQYNVPEFASRGAQYLIRVSGSSMYPKYSNGDILACRKIVEVTFFQWGKVYVLDTNQGALVKRLFEDKGDPDKIICHSDNYENYPDFKLSKSDIRSMSIVIGVIRLD